MASFPYGICRMCGADSSSNGVWALRLSSFVDLVQDLLQIKIKDTDKCSQLVCMPCVKKIKEFGLYAKQAKDLQKSIDNYILFQEQEKDAVRCKIEAEDIIFIDDDLVPTPEEFGTAEHTQTTASITSPDFGDSKNDLCDLLANSPVPETTHNHDYAVAQIPSVPQQYRNSNASPLNPEHPSISPKCSKVYSQTITAIVNPQGMISFHSTVANPENSMTANLRTPQNSIPDVSSNLIQFEPDDVPHQISASASSTDLSGVGLFNTTHGRGLSGHNNSYNSDGYDYKSNGGDYKSSGGDYKSSGSGYKSSGYKSSGIDYKNSGSGYKNSGSDYKSNMSNSRNYVQERPQFRNFASGGRRGGGRGRFLGGPNGGSNYNSEYQQEPDFGTFRGKRDPYDGYGDGNQNNWSDGANFCARYRDF